MIAFDHDVNLQHNSANHLMHITYNSHSDVAVFRLLRSEYQPFSTNVIKNKHGELPDAFMHWMATQLLHIWAKQTLVGNGLAIVRQSSFESPPARLLGLHIHIGLIHCDLLCKLRQKKLDSPKVLTIQLPMILEPSQRILSNIELTLRTPCPDICWQTAVKSVLRRSTEMFQCGMEPLALTS